MCGCIGVSNTSLEPYQKIKTNDDKNLASRAVSKIYTPIFTFFRKRVVNIDILELELVLNESPGNFTIYRGSIH